VAFVGRPPIRKSGALTPTERQRRWRRKLAREKKLANPKLMLKQQRREAHERVIAAKILALPDKRYGVIYGDPEWRFKLIYDLPAETVEEYALRTERSNEGPRANRKGQQ
jgi:hypothetical protein